MEVVHATPENFDTETSSGNVVVDFYADWCPPCKMIAPVLEQLAEEYGDKLKFVKLDTNTPENAEIANKFGIMSIPTLVLLKDGDEFNRFQGFQAKESLKTALDEAFGLADA